MKQLHMNPTVTKAGIGLCLLALLAIGGISFAHKGHTEEVQPSNTASIVVDDNNGTRTCDLYAPDDAGIKASLEAYAKKSGCTIKAWYKSVEAKVHSSPKADTPVASEELVQPNTSTPTVAPSKTPTLSVAPAPASQVVTTK